MEFGEFDDSLFEEKPSRATVTEDYQARQCEAGWFMEVMPEQLVSQEDEFGVKKFTADYLYLRHSFDGAAAKYEEILDGLAESSTTTRRECQENLARCFIKLGTPDVALEHSDKLHSTSKTVEQLSVSYALLMDVNLATSRYSDALIAAQSLISLHPDSGHYWMKLGYIYASLLSVTLPNVSKLLHAHLPASAHTNVKPTAEPSTLQEHSHHLKDGGQGGELHSTFEVREQVKVNRDVLIVAACLQRAYYILVKTEGTSVGFAVSNTKFLKEKLLADLKSLLDDCSLKELRHNVHQNDKVELSSCSDSIYKESDEICGDYINKVSKGNFEEKWFRWIS